MTNTMLDRFLKKSTFTSQEDFEKNFEFVIPENFNFAYDVMDVWAEETPDRLALLWCNDKGIERRSPTSDANRTRWQVTCSRWALGRVIL